MKPSCSCGELPHLLDCPLYSPYVWRTTLENQIAGAHRTASNGHASWARQEWRVAQNISRDWRSK